MASKLEESGVLNKDVERISFEDIIKNNPGGTVAKYAGLLESRFVNELIAEGRTDITDEVIDPCTKPRPLSISTNCSTFFEKPYNKIYLT